MDDTGETRCQLYCLLLLLPSLASLLLIPTTIVVLFCPLIIQYVMGPTAQLSDQANEVEAHIRGWKNEKFFERGNSLLFSRDWNAGRYSFLWSIVHTIAPHFSGPFRPCIPFISTYTHDADCRPGQAVDADSSMSNIPSMVQQTKI
jgi:hypothetical protein